LVFVICAYFEFCALVFVIKLAFMGLKNKRILITAGPTWVPIDSVRVISNIATGTTGVLLARESSVRGARVTLLLGPCAKYNLNNSIRVINFRFFSELKDILRRELKNKNYDIVIHSAAVSDFKPEYKLKGKLNSDKGCRLKLIPLEKLVVLIRRFTPKSILVMFKLESTVTDKTLIRRAKSSRDMVGADMVVANRLNPYRAFIIDKEGNRTKVKNRKQLAKKLIKLLNAAFDN
jgi:phosphopantothenoylcysteine decarboxylase/phosphopantothenate--cysteine ligase